MLNIHNVTKIYNQITYANNNVSFSLEKGNLVWISGVTGSGKTTLLNMLSAVDIPDQGTIVWENNTISAMNENERADFRLKHLGLVFQSLELIKALNAFDNVALPLRYAKYLPSDIKLSVEKIFEYLNITDLIKKYPREMSGGQQQRVALARALVHNPTYILGDEISSALDTNTAHFIYQKIQQYIKDQNGIGILISHDPTIGSYADKHYQMKDGILEVL